MPLPDEDSHVASNSKSPDSHAKSCIFRDQERRFTRGLQTAKTDRVPAERLLAAMRYSEEKCGGRVRYVVLSYFEVCGNGRLQ